MGELVKVDFNKMTPNTQYSHHPFGFSPKVTPQNIPNYMKENCLWCVWRAVEKHRADGSTKIDKVPYSPQGRLSTAKPKLWMNYENAYALYSETVDEHGKYYYNGVGILVKDIVGVDIDGDLDLGIWDKINTYKEFSPSGKGLRIMGTGWTDYDLTKPVEIYSGNAPRFVTITGDTLNGAELLDIGDIANEIVLTNKDNVIDVEKITNIDIPEPLRFDGQDWWPPNHLKLPPVGQRSDTLYGWSKTLISEGLTDRQIFSVYMATPEIIEMAKDHRNGKLEKAKVYLWKDILKARADAIAEYDNDLSEFADIEGLVDFDDAPMGDKKKPDTTTEIEHLGHLELESTGDTLVDKLKLEYEEQDDGLEMIHKGILRAVKDNGVEPPLGFNTIDRVYRRAVVNGKNSKVLCVDNHGFLKEYKKADYLASELKAGYTIAKSSGAVSEDYAKDCAKVFINNLYKYRQINRFENSVDMFIKKPIMIRTTSGLCKVINPHLPFDETGPIDKNSKTVITEYTHYFPLLHTFLDYIVAARFASNRRMGGLWLNASSNWGKGFLMSVFDSFGIVLSITEKEIEKAFEGHPLGKNLSTAHTSWILFVDEFSKVKAEIKLLDNSLTGSSKNQLEMKIPVYSKVFASAEDVQALTGDAGPEKQFAKRFSYFGGKQFKADIDNLPIWNLVGNSRYFEIIKRYIAIELNIRVEKYRSLGRYIATMKADKELKTFHQKHCITNTFTGMDELLPDYKEAFKHLVNRVWGNGGGPLHGARGREADLHSLIYSNTILVEHKAIKFLLVKKPKQVINSFLYNEGGAKEGLKLSHKASSVIDLFGDNYRKCNPIINGMKHKGTPMRGVFVEYNLEEQGLKDFDDI